MSDSNPHYAANTSQPWGQTGDYSNYAFEQIVKAIQGGFSNDPNYTPVSATPLYTAALDLGDAGTALQNAGLGLVKQVQNLLGTTDSPGWTGDAADEFAAIMYAILTWLDDCIGKIGSQYSIIMGNSGDNLRQAQAGLNKIMNDSVNSVNAANAASQSSGPDIGYAWTAADN